MEPILNQEKRHCPLCGERVYGNDQEEREHVIYTLFPCKNNIHYAPYNIVEYREVEARQNRTLFISSSTNEVIMRGPKMYCFLCGSELNTLFQRAHIGMVEGKEKTLYGFMYECVQRGHMWYVDDQVKYLTATFFTFRAFDALLLEYGIVSRHHIVIPAHRTKRYLWRLLLRDSFVV